MKFIVSVIFILGVSLIGLTYSCYSEYELKSRRARFFRMHPDEVPLLANRDESREQYIARELRSADRNRNLAVFGGAGSLLLCVGGAALFIRGRKKNALPPLPESGLNKDPMRHVEVMNRWAGVALARPVEVHFKQIYAVLFASLMVFFIGASLLMIVVNGLKGVSVLLLIVNGGFVSFFAYFMRRAQGKSASLFDINGVKRCDKKRFNWSDFKSVDYRMAIRPRSGKEYLWRIELVFDNGEARIIPQRIRNLDEVENLVTTLPGTHQKRRI